MKVCDNLFGFNRTRTFAITMMENLRVGASRYWQGNTYVMSDGRIQFDYNSRMVSIGGNVAEAEAEAFRVVGSIRSQITPEKIGR